MKTTPGRLVTPIYVNATSVPDYRKKAGADVLKHGPLGFDVDTTAKAVDQV